LKKRTVESQKLYSRIYSLVKSIPPGKVCTYGGITGMAGLGKNYRLIGYALHNLPADSDVPWHRVVNRFGRISYAPSRGGHDNLQRILLEQEGIEFDKDDKISLVKFGYNKHKLN
jgi:methylated-DNA-protein-cysteine methyltransferase-like protein